MSQYDFGDLESPLSGTALVNTHLEPWRNALHSQHSGASRPSYAVAGMIWVESDTTPWNIWVFDGSQDILLGTVDVVNDLFTPAGSLIYSWCGTSGGTANAQTFTPARPIAAYATGQAFEGIISTPNTSAGPTINISAIGAKTVKVYTPSGKVNAPVGILQGVCRFVYDGTDLILLNPRPYNKGASIATASTVNLDGAGADFVHLTGTTTVNAFTLAEGQQKVCVADGAFTITDGTGNSPQGIICPGAANITTAAGDVFMVRGEGSGTTRIISYTKADGTPLVSGGVSAGWVPISTQTVSTGVASVNFTGLSSLYKAYKVVMSKVVLATDEQGIRVQTSGNNGSSYDSTSGDYAFSYLQILSNSGTAGGAATISGTYIGMGGTVTGNDTGQNTSGELTVFDPADTTKHKIIDFNLALCDRDGNASAYYGCGVRKTTTAVNAIKIYSGSGNINAGTFTLYGLKEAS